MAIERPLINQKNKKLKRVQYQVEISAPKTEKAGQGDRGVGIQLELHSLKKFFSRGKDPQDVKTAD